jgi:hypothetical protein
MKNKLEDYFFNKPKKLAVHKWHHYLEIYDNHFKRFLGKTPTLLEIGLGGGGSIEMWNYYFDGQCNLYGIDIHPARIALPTLLNSSNIQVDLGDQSDRNFWKNYLKDKPKFDIVIDDGGHTMEQQIITFEEIYDHISDDGVYLCEDLHTSYMDKYKGGFRQEETFIEYSKNLIDGLNAQYFNVPNESINKQLKHIRATAKSFHYYDSVFVIEKGIVEKSIATRRK